MKSISCDLCKENNFKHLFNGKDYLSFSPLTFELKECKRCGLVSLNPRPEDITKYYRDYRKGPVKKDGFEFLASNRIKKIKKFKKSGRILDIGCGQGGFLHSMAKDYWETYGVELSKDACDVARETYGLKEIYNGDLLSSDLPDNFFDVITLWHVLEHLDKPLDTLKKINKMLKEDGVLIIESPDFSSIQSRFFKDKWFNLDVPRHLYQFSPKIVKKYLKEVNFKIIKGDYIVNPLINFVSFKKSLLRWLGVQRAPKTEISNTVESGNHVQKGTIIWRFFSVSCNMFCLSIALLLNVIRCDDSFRVYCGKNNLL